MAHLVANALHELDDVLELEETRLEEAIARQLGYRLGRELSPKERRMFADPQYDAQWFAFVPGRAAYEPVPPVTTDFSRNMALVCSLPLPEASDRYEDWIHAEMGPNGRWIVRLLRFNRAGLTFPWKSTELFIADSDDDPIPLATAYGQAWLCSHYTWPESGGTDLLSAA
jgi:hypothetical protein